MRENAFSCCQVVFTPASVAYSVVICSFVVSGWGAIGISVRLALMNNAVATEEALVA